MAAACPLCREPLYPWIALPPAPGEASVGMPLEPDSGPERVLDRCQTCGVALERGREVDVEAEWVAVDRRAASADGSFSLPNRASLQATIGAEGWTAIDDSPGDLILTPRSLELLAQRTGHRIGAVRTPICGRAQLWMWRTLLNGLTFHPNFEREARAGRLRASSARGRLRYAADALVTVLAAPLVLLASAPLELAAALAKRGGLMVASTGEARRGVG